MDKAVPIKSPSRDCSCRACLVETMLCDFQGEVQLPLGTLTLGTQPPHCEETQTTWKGHGQLGCQPTQPELAGTGVHSLQMAPPSACESPSWRGCRYPEARKIHFHHALSKLLTCRICEHLWNGFRPLHLKVICFKALVPRTSSAAGQGLLKG